ncbi:MAG TPA: tetratricopeptide repeat protein [Anaerolineaceae bacterium]|nr:tetratricopeptide repeat protein [Anaerolineaceae bacterium]
MAAANIIDISEDTFEFEVVNYSMQVPVVLDLWAPWCIPCRVQSRDLTKLAHEADGGFRLARINVDDQPKLATRLKVQQVPAVKAFVDGRIVAEVTGVLSEQNLRLLVDRVLPKAGNLLLEKGKSLMLLGDLAGAEEALAQYVFESHGEPAGLLALARALLWQGKAHDAYAILNSFPASSEFKTAKSLLPLAKAYASFDTLPQLSANPLEAAYRNSLRLARSGKIEIALDGFLDILRRDKHFHDDQLHDVYLALLEVLGDGYPTVRQYRDDLSNVLF